MSAFLHPMSIWYIQVVHLLQVHLMCIQSWELFLILPPLCRNQSAISITLSCLFIFVEQYSRYKRAAYTRLKRHFIGIRPFRRDVQMAVIEEHSGILLMNFTISELIYRKDFRFYQNVGLLNVLLHG